MVQKLNAFIHDYYYLVLFVDDIVTDLDWVKVVEDDRERLKVGDTVMDFVNGNVVGIPVFERVSVTDCV